MLSKQLRINVLFDINRSNVWSIEEKEKYLLLCLILLCIGLGVEMGNDVLFNALLKFIGDLGG